MPVFYFLALSRITQKPIVAQFKCSHLFTEFFPASGRQSVAEEQQVGQGRNVTAACRGHR